MRGIIYLMRRLQGDGEKSKVIMKCMLVMIMLCLTGLSWAEDVQFSSKIARSALQTTVTPCGGAGVGHAKPAADYCLEMGYELDTFERHDGTQSSVCVFPDNTSCPAWRFLDGRCGADWSICAQSGYGIITKSDGKNPYSPYYAVCVDSYGNEAGTVLELMDQPRKYKSTVNVYSGILSLKRESAAKAEPMAVGALPAKFDWRNYDGKNWMTPVKDQSACGSCWAFSAVGATEAAHNIAADDPDLDLDLSEEYLNANCTEWSPGSCCGGWHSSALDRILEEGIPDEDCMPYNVGYYDTGSCGCFPTGICDDRCTGPQNGGTCSQLVCPDDLCNDADERLTTIKEYKWVNNDRDQIKQALVEKGPLAVCLAMRGSFENGVYECPDNVGTNHCIVIVGYDEAGKYWITKNSWGGDWDDDGYFNVGYGECNIESDVYWVEAASGPTVASLTNGMPKGKFQKGQQTDEVTEPNTWRWAENYFGFKHIDQIQEQIDACTKSHTYVIGWHQNDLAEYLMKFGGKYDTLVVRGKADRPKPVKLEIWIDAKKKATVELDDGDNCNQDVTVRIPGLDYGTHAIAVKFVNDKYDRKKGADGDRNFYLDGIMVKGSPEIKSITNGMPKGKFQAGYQTDEVTEPGKWRWAERYYGFKHIDQIKSQKDPCSKKRHTYAIGWHQKDLIEYLMKFGGDYNRLELLGKADRPGPVKLEIWIDGKKKTNVYLDKNNNCNQNKTVQIKGLTYGTHAIAVKFVNDKYDAKKGADGDRNFYLDGIRVKK